jgi:predicted RNase H-related nuclease YkuK (DUF458 family)
MRINLDDQPVKARFLLIVIAAFVIGAGGKFAYDTYQEHERQKSLDQKVLEESLSGNNCSFCSLVQRGHETHQRGS